MRPLPVLSTPLLALALAAAACSATSVTTTGESSQVRATAATQLQAIVAAEPDARLVVLDSADTAERSTVYAAWRGLAPVTGDEPVDAECWITGVVGPDTDELQQSRGCVDLANPDRAVSWASSQSDPFLLVGSVHAGVDVVEVRFLDGTIARLVPMEAGVGFTRRYLHHHLDQPAARVLDVHVSAH